MLGAEEAQAARIDGPRWRVGDNAAMESFFSLLKENVLDRRPGASKFELRPAIVTWIKGSANSNASGN